MSPPEFIIPDEEIEFTAMRAQGAGGQNVNKVASAVQLRFDIRHSSLPQRVRLRLLASHDQRINKQGVLILKAQIHRSQDRNRAAALERLHDIVGKFWNDPSPRYPTKPTHAAKLQRLQDKSRRAGQKALRARVE